MHSYFGCLCCCLPAPAAKEHGLEHEVLDSRQVAQRFPGVRLPPSFQTLYEPEGGLLVPEKCIEVHLRLAQQQGAQLMCGTQVLGWQVLPPGAEALEGSGAGGGSAVEASGSGSSSGGEGLVRVHTSRGSFTTRRLVLAGGGWMPKLVPELKVGGRGWGGGCCRMPLQPAHSPDCLPASEAIADYPAYPACPPSAAAESGAPGGGLV